MEPQEEMKEVLNEQEEVIQEAQPVGQEEGVGQSESNEEEGNKDSVQEPEKKPKKTLEERKKEIAEKTWKMRETERRAKAAFEQAQEMERLAIERENKLREQFPDQFKDKGKQEPPKPQRSEEEIAKEYLAKKKQEEVMQNWGVAREVAIQDDPSFEQKEAKIAQKLEVSGNVDVVKAILESDDPISMINYLNDNAEKLDKISNLSPFGAAKEIGKIEVALGQYEKPKTTKAPPPIQRVKGSGAPKMIHEMSFEEFEREQNKKQFGG